MFRRDPAASAESASRDRLQEGQHDQRTPTSRLIKLPTGSRRLAGSPRLPPSISGLMALPRLAPRTSASAASGRHEMRIGERHHQQHDGHTRMRRPGQRRGDDDTHDRIAGDRAEQRTHHRRAVRPAPAYRAGYAETSNIRPSPMRRGRGRVVQACCRRKLEGDEAEDEQDRRDRRRRRRTAPGRSASCRHWRRA